MENEQRNNLCKWLAGMIEGDGHIGIYIHQRNDRVNKIRVFLNIILVTTSLKIKRCIEIILDDLKINYDVQIINYKNPKWSTRYTIRIRTFENVEKVLKIIFPFLQGKREEAEILLEVLNFRKDKGTRDVWDKQFILEKINLLKNLHHKVYPDYHFEDSEHCYNWYTLGGIIDAEGSVTFIKSSKKGKNDQFWPMIDISNCNPQIIQATIQLFKKYNLPYYLYSRSDSNKNHRERFVIRIMGVKRVKKFIPYLKDKLIEKGDSLELLNQFIEMREKNYPKPYNLEEKEIIKNTRD